MSIDEKILRSSSCVVCQSKHTLIKDFVNTTKGLKGKTLKFQVCKDCKFSFSQDNFFDYVTDGKTAGFATSLPTNNERTGDGLTPGREFHMFDFGRKILGRNNLEVVVFGAGLSLDHSLIRAASSTSSCHLADLVNFQKSEYFLDLSVDCVRKSDVVIASEVVEHFTDPINNFAKLLSYCSNTGVTIVSTNISDGCDLGRLTYPWIKGHTAYYHGETMLFIADKLGYSIDFRLPMCATAKPGPRKRYILFYKDIEIRRKIALYFAENAYAASE